MDTKTIRKPAYDVEWKIYPGIDGKPGLSRCYPQDAESCAMLEKYGQTYVQYKRGEPNFTPFSETSIRITNMSSDRQKNFGLAREKLLETDWAKSHNLTNKSQVKEYCKNNNLTLHECPDGVTIMLVPRDIHQRFVHDGGVAAMKRYEDYNIDIKDGLSGNVEKTSEYIRININKNGTVVEQKVGDTLTTFHNNELISSAHEAGSCAALTGATTSAIHNIFMVAYGEKDIEEATKDVVIETSSAYVAGAVRGACRDVALKNAKKYTSEQMYLFLKNDIARVGTEIIQIIEASKSVYKFLDGQIDSEECVYQIASSAVGTMAFTVGNMVLPPIGGVAAQMISEYVCQAIYTEVMRVKSIVKSNQNKISKINALANEALCEMELHREMLQSEMHAVYKEWDKSIEMGFSMVEDGIWNQNEESIAKGYNTILGIFDKRVAFNTLEEFDDFLNSGSVLMF